MSSAVDLSTLLSAPMALGWLVAPLAVFIAMELLGRVRLAKAGEALRWRMAAALALGTGLWSSQVISLTARVLPLAVGYHPLGAFGAWVLAMAVALAALNLASGTRDQNLPLWRVLAGACVMGVGMVGAQAVAMAAAGFRPGLQWHFGGLGLALAVAVAGSAGALALLANNAMPAPGRAGVREASAALGAGVAMILSQHLAMGASGWSTQLSSEFDQRLSAGELNLLASVGTVVLLLALLLLSRVEAHMRATLQKTKTELAEHALQDPVTKLPNRLRFEGTLAQAVQQADQRDGRLALIFINIDRFKHVNESGGHRSGDSLLCELGTRLRTAAKPHMVARVGGDEFVLLMAEDPRQDDVSAKANELLKLIGEPCKLDGLDCSVTGSIGIAMYPEDGALSTMISHADMAMRVAKSTGGASYCFFEARMVSGAREQAELLRELRQALARRELELLYQPKIHAPTGEVTGAEALIRWHHAKRGLVSPTVFIPIAERFGLIKDIGDWVIDEACRQVRAWRDEGLRMRVAINLSPYQLRDPELGSRIDAALKRHQINPKLLTCEITESVAMEDSQATLRFFEVLAGVGVHISIDDFGTGYSSLAYLRKLPAEELKIDRSFVCDLETSEEARTVAAAVVKLGQALNLKVVAEGVETEAQNQILRSLGCDELQGYLFAKPMSAKALALWAMNDVGPSAMAFRPSLFQPTAPAPI